MTRVFALSAILLITPAAPAQTDAAAPTTLPGSGLAQHDFFYAGEGRTQRMYLVRQGKVVWTYDDPTTKGEISDAVRLSNGNILFAQFGVTLITPEKKVLWNYDTPAGTEIHTAVPSARTTSSSSRTASPRRSSSWTRLTPAS